jgi:hypothetical protein
MATIRRATDRMIKKKMIPYVMALGKVAHAWNYLQESLGQMFSTVTGLEERTGEAIWHSTANDRAQREMLRAAVRVSWDPKLTTELPKAKEDIKWLLDKANSVAEQRNNAIHAPMSVAIGQNEIELFPVVYHGNPRAHKLIGKDILTEFEWYEKSAETLTRFARHVRAAIIDSGVSWPDRPQMPALQQKTTQKTPRRKSAEK